MPSLEFMLESNSGEPSAKGSGITVMTEDSRVQNSQNTKSRRGGRRPSALGSALGSLQGPDVPSTDQDTCVGTVDSRTLKDSTTTRKAKRPGGRRPSRLDCLDKEKLRSCFA